MPSNDLHMGKQVIYFRISKIKVSKRIKMKKASFYTKNCDVSNVFQKAKGHQIQKRSDFSISLVSPDCTTWKKNHITVLKEGQKQIFIDCFELIF